MQDLTPLCLVAQRGGQGAEEAKELMTSREAVQLEDRRSLIEAWAPPPAAAAAALRPACSDSLFVDLL
jgi:hypothetical protein